MANKHEQGEKTLSLRIQRAADTVHNLGRSVVKVLDIIPPTGAHALRRDRVGQLRIDDFYEPKHSQKSGEAFLSVEGVKQIPEQPVRADELIYQPLLTHKEQILPRHQPSWTKPKDKN